MSTAIMQSLTFVILIVSEKIATLKFLPYTNTRPAGPKLITIVDSCLQAALVCVLC